MKKEKQGLLIVIEGIDGAGKSTLARNLKTILNNYNYQVLLTKEPGGSLLGSYIRNLLLEQKIQLGDKAEYLLFAADRAQHIKEIIIPALYKNNVVISDRMADSSVVYQGYGRGLDIQMIKTINAWTMNNIIPNLTIYLQLKPAIAFKRIAQRGAATSFEKKELIEKVLKGFEQLYKDRDDVLLLDATQPPDVIAQQAAHYIIDMIK